MTSAAWLPLTLFAFVSSITPGPNNLLATASGARFGLRRTLPQIAGVTAGFTVMLFLTAAGAAALMATHPIAALVLAALGYAYLGWLALRLLSAAWRPSAVGRREADRPLTFLESAAFQFANPKAWMMALSATTGFLAVDGRSAATIAALGALFAAINFPCVGAWALLGARLQGWLNDPSAAWRMRAFNAAMAVALLATLAMMIAMR